jgi:hypothetical protein
MDTLALSLAFIFAAAPAFTQAPPQEPSSPDATLAPRGSIKTYKVEAEVVTPDLENKTLTYKQDGSQKSAPVGALAMYRLKRIKAGDKVTLTCREGAAPTECKEITFIKAMVVAPAASPSTPQ